MQQTLLSKWHDMFRCLLFFPVIFFVASCANKNNNIDFSSHALASKKALNAQIAKEEKVTKPISLYEAMARALKYNLDQKIELMEIDMKQKQLEARSAEMLPKLVAGLIYNNRNNDSGSRSKSLLSGRESLEPSTSLEREGLSSNLALSWNILDFGISRARARQNANEKTISVERRRKVINRILEDVRTAYWRAVSADRAATRLVNLEGLTERALAQSQQLETRRIASPSLILDFQRNLLQIKGELQRLQRELQMAKNQLAALMNLYPGEDFELVLPERNIYSPELPGSVNAMLLTGLRFRPEVREAAYRQKMLDEELSVTLLRAMPSLSTIFSANNDTNSYLYNNDWVSLSTNLSWNIFELYKYPKAKRALEAEKKALEQRDMALAMAVVTQIYIARARYIQLVEELNTARNYSSVQTRILDQTRNAYKAGAVSQQTLIQEEMNTLLNDVRFDVAYADAQNAYANLFSSMGLDNFSVSLDSINSVGELATALETHWLEGAQNLPAIDVVTSEDK